MLFEHDFDPNLCIALIAAVRQALEKTYEPSTIGLCVCTYLNFLDEFTISIMIHDISQAIECEKTQQKEMWEEVRAQLEVETYTRKKKVEN